MKIGTKINTTEMGGGEESIKWRDSYLKKLNQNWQTAKLTKQKRDKTLIRIREKKRDIVLDSEENPENYKGIF